MFAFVITIHAIACVLLILIVLVQQGRGGGLIDSLSSAESIFGTKTNTFLVKSTSVLAVVFFVTCLSLAFLSIQRSKSLLKSYKVPLQETEIEKTTPAPSTSAQETKQPAPQATSQAAPQASQTQAAAPAPATENKQPVAPAVVSAPARSDSIGARSRPDEEERTTSTAQPATATTPAAGEQSKVEK